MKKHVWIFTVAFIKENKWLHGVYSSKSKAKKAAHKLYGKHLFFNEANSVFKIEKKGLILGWIYMREIN